MTAMPAWRTRPAPQPPPRSPRPPRPAPPLGRPAAADPEREDLVAHRHGPRPDPGVGADGAHHTGDLVADRLRKVRRVAAGHMLGVSGVHARRPDRDRDLPFFRRSNVILLEREDVQVTRPGRNPVLCHSSNLDGMTTPYGEGDGA